MKHTIWTLALLSLSGCGSGGPADADGGPDTRADVGTWTTQACMDARLLVGELGGLVEISGDSRTPELPMLANSCLLGDPVMPVEVVAYLVPGEGEVGIEATIGSDLPLGEQHVPSVEIRRDCDAPGGYVDGFDRARHCSMNWDWDDADSRISELGTVARGGDLLFFHVVALDITESLVPGPWTLRVGTTGASAPVIESATVLGWDSGYVEYRIEGRDDDGNAHALWITAWDADGLVIQQIWGGPEDFQSRKINLPDPDGLVGQTSFTRVGYHDLEREPATVELRLVDLTRLESEPMTVVVTP